jgi:hypothetical protein
LHACLASESHVEMLPDWMPIANDAPVKSLCMLRATIERRK